jgi:hypothetical protein
MGAFCFPFVGYLWLRIVESSTTDFNYPLMGDRYDRHSRSGELMGDRHSHPIRRNVVQRFLSRRLSFILYRRSCLIQNQDGWFFEENRGDRC